MKTIENPEINYVKSILKDNNSRKALLREIRKLGMSLALGMSLLRGVEVGVEKYEEYKETQHTEMFRKEGVKKENDIKIKVSSIESDGEEGKISAEHLREILLGSYPLSWVDDISSITQVAGKSQAGSKYGEVINKHATVVASCSKNLFSAKSEIVFYDKTILGSFDDIVNKTLSHELGHAYRNSLIHSGPELDKKIRERLMESDRYQSSYVEAITNKKKEIEEMVKGQEYWAEIVGQFFADASQLNIKDFQLVAGEVSKTDPDFNWVKAREKRDDVILSADQEQVKTPIVIGEFSAKDRIENGKLLITVEFEYKGRHYQVELKGDKEAAGIKGKIFYRSDGFVYFCNISHGLFGKGFSFLFQPKSASKIAIYNSWNMDKITEIDAIS